MLKIEGLNAHYGASHVLWGVDLEMPRGRISAVLGRNGVGKTTTVKTVMGLVAPSGGHIWLDGIEITGWQPHRVARAGVAYVPEGRLVFPDLTVLDLRIGYTVLISGFGARAPRRSSRFCRATRMRSSAAVSAQTSAS